MYTGLRPKDKGNLPDSLMKPSIIRDELQHLLGAALPDCILSGGTITPGTGLTANISALTAIIGGKYHKADPLAGVALTARMASLLYLEKNSATDSVAPVIGKVDAVLPPVDANTILRYDFSNWDGVSAIPNSAVGVNGNTIAVANNLVLTNPTPGTSLKRVDGHVGYAMQGDGATGFGVSQNNTNIPINTAIVEFRTMFVVNVLPATTQMIFDLGTTDGYKNHGLCINSSGNLAIFAGDTPTFFDSSFKVDVGRTYIVKLQYDGVRGYIFVDGTLVYTSGTYVHGATSLVTLSLFARNYASARYYANITMHYFEIKNILSTPEQIAQISNKLCLPCAYTADYKDISNLGAAIADGHAGSAVEGNAYDGSSSTYWQSSIAVVNMIGRAYIGRNFLVPKMVKKIMLQNYSNANYNITSAIIQVSFDGVNWLTIDTYTLPTTINIWNEIVLPDYTPAPYIRVLANSTIIAGDPWVLWELKFYENATTGDIREILPENSVSLGRALTGSTAVKDIRMDYQDGRREGAFGGNRGMLLVYKYFSGTTTLYWDNPFGTRKIKIKSTWAQDTNGKNEVPTRSMFISGSDVIGVTESITSAGKISVATGAAGVTSLNGVTQTSGYLRVYVEVIE